jgi:hypothetical protein
MKRRFHFHTPGPFGAVPATFLRRRRTERSSILFQAQSLLWRLGLAGLLVLLYAELARAGGPKYIAGVSFFNSGLAGHPITWSGGTVTYYTDQGDLSPLLPGASADSFVADAFSRWTGISTAAVSATRGGQLAENVSGFNVILSADGSITLPNDIQPSATGTPVGIVYDYDGAVTDALLGTGSSSDCLVDSAIGGPDAFTADGHFAHALVVVNGLCAQTSAQLPDMKFQLVRVLGEVFGLGWSQLNLNVTTGSPYPTSNDKAGFPVMHASDQRSCVPVSLCYSNADQPKLDDQAALSRLYPVTSQNRSQFPGKQIFSTSTVRIHGSVRFTDAYGNPGQAMQGVNVVARWIDPNTGQPSTQYTVSSVSGYAFSGNAGNPITGYNDVLGQPLNRFGSADPTLEGSFDLAGMVLPSGTSGQFQLSVEAVDPMWSEQVGPYAPWQVLPSGTFPPVTVTASLGSDVQQDIVMRGSAVQSNDPGEPSSFASPVPLPKSGIWMGNLGNYGDVDYFSLNAQSGRTAVIDVITLDENGKPTEKKAEPVIGAWSISDPVGTLAPAVSTSSFNVVTAGVTRLSADFLSTGQFRIGIGDLRGDGRPDYRYLAHVLYGDTVEPSRVGVQGGTPIEIAGIGFRSGITATVGSANASLLSVTPTEVLFSAPSLADGIQAITITDPSTGASLDLTNALTLGAGPNDMIRLTQSANSPTPVGGEAAYPIRVMVTSADGAAAVSGATVHWSVSNGATLTACNGAPSCSVLTDESGKVQTRVDVGATGTSTITASLAPASYSPAKYVQTVVSGTSSATDLALFTPKVWVAKGATVDVPLTARLLSNGSPVSGRTINFQVLIGSGTLNPANANTDATGYARSSLRLTGLTTDVQGTACLAPSNNPCQSFYVVAVDSALLHLETVQGGEQAIWVGQSFRPLQLRVTDSSTPGNPVQGATVSLQGMMYLPTADDPVATNGDSAVSNHPMQVVLGSFQNSLVSDANGLVTINPSNGGLYRPVDLEIMVSAGTSANLQFAFQQLPAMMTETPGASTGRARAPAGTGTPRKIGPVRPTSSRASKLHQKLLMDQ